MKVPNFIATWKYATYDWFATNKPLVLLKQHQVFLFTTKLAQHFPLAPRRMELNKLKVTGLMPWSRKSLWLKSKQVGALHGGVDGWMVGSFPGRNKTRRRWMGFNLLPSMSMAKFRCFQSTLGRVVFPKVSIHFTIVGTAWYPPWVCQKNI